MGYAVGGGWRLVAKPCDCCSSAQALLFCRTDSAYLCISCDSKIHATSKLAPKHERVWMCEVCEKAAASVTCKADAAALCVTCDRDIHTANPLSQRHERVPVVPFYETTNSVVKVKSTTDSTYLVPVNNSDILSTCDARDGGGGYVIDEWISPKTIGLDNKLLFSDTENYLEFDYPISSEAQYQHVCRVTDGVVPVQTIKSTVQPQLPVHSSEKHFEIDFTNSHINNYTQSLSQSVSTSSVDIGVVPDGSSMSEISYPFGTSVDMGGGNQAAAPLPLPLIGMDREARVLRYREKRKNRKFEKTIRYASRKAYAETRPRIKGRFAKRTQVDSNVDRMFSLDHLLSFNQ